jgi:hypothetical protein
MFNTVKTEREPVEEMWIDSLRRYKGEYDSVTLARIKANNGSEIYPKTIRAKILFALSKIREIIFPDFDKSWTIKPTPVPSISDAIKNQIQMSLLQQDEAGNLIPPNEEEINIAITDYVNSRCKNMEIEMEDQLLDMNYEQIMMDGILSSLIYGLGVVKGVLAKTYKETFWTPSKNSTFKQVSKEVSKPYAEAVPVWNIYPDTSVTSFKDCGFIFERHIFSKTDLLNLALRPDFNSEAIYKIIKDNPNGKVNPANWEQQLYTTDSSKQRVGKYEVLEFWGYVSATDLLNAGFDIKDISEDELNTTELFMNIWLFDNTVIKIIENPMEDYTFPYHFIYFEKDDTNIFGYGIPHISKDTDTAICAATRMMLDNASITTAPQFELNLDLLVEGQDITTMHSKKIWLREGRGVDAQYPLIRAYQFDSRVQELLSIISQFKQFSDEETAIPSYSNIDSKTTGETARGVSMRLSSLGIIIKNIVKNIDLCTKGFLTVLYNWNMKFNPKTEIKGDFAVAAYGSQSLVSKEVRMQSLDFFAQTLTPEERERLNIEKFLHERLKAHDLSPLELLKTPEQVAADSQQRQQMDAELYELEKQKILSDLEYDKAKSLHMLAKAKTQNLKKETIGLEKEALLSNIEYTKAKIAQLGEKKFE